MGLDGDKTIEHYNRPRSIVAMVALCQPGGIMLSIAPVSIAAFVSANRFDLTQATRLGSMELAAMTAGMLLTSLVIGRFDRRHVASSGIVTAVLGHLLAIRMGMQGVYGWALLAQAIAGVGEGVATASGVAALAGLRVPDRGFGFAVTGNLLGGAAMFALLPVLLEAGGLAAVLGVITGYTLVFGLGAGFLPTWTPVLADEKGGERTVGSAGLPLALLGLGATFVFMMGIGTVWPVTPQFGEMRHVPAGQISSTLALAALVSAGVGVFVGWLGVRFGRSAPIVLGAAGTAAAMVALPIDLGATSYTIAAIVLMMFWMFSVPFYLGALAMMDSGGRLVAVSMAFQSLGLAVGQALTAWFLASGQVTPLIANVGAALVILAAALMSGAMAAVRSNG
jgi:hypothetical protein